MESTYKYIESNSWFCGALLKIKPIIWLGVVPSKLKQISSNYEKHNYYSMDYIEIL